METANDLCERWKMEEEAAIEENARLQVSWGFDTLWAGEQRGTGGREGGGVVGKETWYIYHELFFFHIVIGERV